MRGLMMDFPLTIPRCWSARGTNSAAWKLCGANRINPLRDTHLATFIAAHARWRKRLRAPDLEKSDSRRDIDVESRYAFGSVSRRSFRRRSSAHIKSPVAPF